MRFNDEKIISCQNPAQLLESIQSLPKAYVFVWEIMPDDSLQLRKFHTTCSHWPAFQTITLSTKQVEVSSTYYAETRRLKPRRSQGLATQLYSLMDMLDLDHQIACIHVTYEGISMTKAEEFRAYVNDTDVWKELIFVPIPYDTFDFEWFSLETIHGLCLEVTPLTNANEDIGMAIAYAYQKQK